MILRNSRSASRANIGQLGLPSTPVMGIKLMKAEVIEANVSRRQAQNMDPFVTEIIVIGLYKLSVRVSKLENKVLPGRTCARYRPLGKPCGQQCTEHRWAE